MRVSPKIAVACLVPTLQTLVSAAPPAIEAVYPAGAQRGTTVTVGVSGKLDPWPVQIWTNRSDVAFTPVDDEKGSIRVDVGSKAAPGVCAFRLYNADGATGIKAFMIGSLPETNEVEPNDDPAKPQPVSAAHVIVNGSFGKTGDADVFAVALRRGETLVASLEAHRRLGSPLDGVLQVLSQDGFVLDHNDDGASLDPQLVFTAPADGTYLIRAFCFPATPDAKIALAGNRSFVYRLTLTTGAFADYVWPLAIDRNRPEDVQAFGWNVPVGLRLPVDVFDFDQALLLHSSELANEVDVAVLPHGATCEIEPNPPAHPQAIETSLTVSGRIENAGDVDAFAFAARRGEPVLLVVESHSLGLPLDPVLSISTISGKRLKRQDDAPSGRDAELLFEPSEDGDYVVAVSDLHGRGGSRFAYRLTVLRPHPAWGLELKSDAFVATSGTRLEIPVSIDRRHGFDEEIEISITGLPEGTMAEPVKSTAKGDSAKMVTLVVNASGERWSGPMRIVGCDKSERRQTATSLNARPGAVTDEIWLTVTPAKN